MRHPFFRVWTCCVGMEALRGIDCDRVWDRLIMSTRRSSNRIDRPLALQTGTHARRMVTAATAAFASPARLLTRLLLFTSTLSPSTPQRHHATTTLLRMSASTSTTPAAIRVVGAGSPEVNGLYATQDPERVPAGFQRTCEKMRWPPQATVREIDVCVCTWPAGWLV